MQVTGVIGLSLGLFHNGRPELVNASTRSSIDKAVGTMQGIGSPRSVISTDFPALTSHR